MSSANNDRISSVARRLDKCKEHLDAVSASDNLLRSRTRQHCYEMAQQAYEIYEMLLKLSESENSTFEEDSDDYSEISTSYSPREIVRKYRDSISEVSIHSFGVIQVNRFASMLSSWYNARYIPERKNPGFNFKADRIWEWIDKLIISYGDAIHNHATDDYIADMNDWIEQIQRDETQIWPIPYFVVEGSESSVLDQCAAEVLLIEKMIKSKLYSADFYPDKSYSIRKIVISNHSELKGLSLTQLMEIVGSEITKTSSFNESDYKEG